jgi:hypothetical protein
MPSALWILGSTLLLLAQTAGLDVTLEKYTESPGLYYDDSGSAQLYSTEWKVVTYVNLEEASQNLEIVKRYASLSITFCKEHEHTFWINFTDCMRTIRHLDRQIREIEDMKLLVKQLTRTDEDATNIRSKRGIFNFIGGISKILFGTMDSEDASYYTDKISDLEREQTEFLKLSKEQMTVVKSTLRSINTTLRDVYENERVLSKGLENMARHVNEYDGEIKRMFTSTSMLLVVNEHSAELDRAMSECRREYETLIEAIINAQKGILQPHIITPTLIMNQMKLNQADFPSDLTLPIPLSAAYHNLVLRVIEVDVFVKGNYLVYVIRLPLTNHVKYSVYHVLPLPIKIRNAEFKFTFILPEREYLLMDVAKQYYARLTASEFKECKLMDSSHRLCKQNYPVQVKHADEACEAELLQSMRSIPASCSQRIVELNQTLWTQLNNNEWLYVAPRVETLTVLCSRQEPRDVEIHGTGKLKMHSMCKGYGSKTLIQAQMTIVSNNTGKDIIPPISLEYDCCLPEKGSTKLSQIHLDLPIKNVVKHLDDLRVASYKVDEVEKIILEQEWKLKHSNMNYKLSILSYFGMITTCLILILFCCCCCCKCFRRSCPNFFRWWKNNNPCTTIVFKPKIVNSVHSSRESLHFPSARSSIKHRRSQDDCPEMTELVLLTAGTKNTGASGKR